MLSGRRVVAANDPENRAVVLVSVGQVCLPGGMASDVKRGKGYTAPKGRPTVHPTAGGRTGRLSSTTEWIIAGIVFIAILAAIFYFGRDFATGGGGTAGLPVEVPIAQVHESTLG